MLMTASHPKGFSIDHESGVLVVTLFWESIIKESALEELRQHVVEQLPQATTAVLFDCRKLTGPATSQFLATLVAVRKAAMREGLFVCVAHLTGPVREAYSVSRLDRIIPSYDDRETAIRAVGDYGLGRIAVGKLEPARLGVAAAATEQREKASGPGVAAGLATEASSMIASAADSWSGMRENMRTASQSLSPQQMVQLGGVAAAVVVSVALAWYFLAPPSSHGASSSSDDRPLVFGGDSSAVLVGQVQVRAGDSTHDDAGALVLVWRVGEGPQQKVLAKTIYRYLNEGVAGEKFPHAWMHAARASETGKFRIGIDVPGEFEVLIISAASERGAALTSTDEQTLAQWFESPRELIGRHPYRLTRQRIEKQEVTLNEVFERGAPK